MCWRCQSRDSSGHHLDVAAAAFFGIPLYMLNKRYKHATRLFDLVLKIHLKISTHVVKSQSLALSRWLFIIGVVFALQLLGKQIRSCPCQDVNRSLKLQLVGAKYLSLGGGSRFLHFTPDTTTGRGQHVSFFWKSHYLFISLFLLMIQLLMFPSFLI